MHKRLFCLVWLCLGVFCGILSADRKPAASQPSLPQKLAMIEGLRSSVVRVAYTLQYDKGQSPNIGGWSGGSCYNPWGDFGSFFGDSQDVIAQERPYEIPGYVLSPTRIVAPDMKIHPRFVKKITILFDGQKIPAKPSAYALDQDAVFLTLDTPLIKAKPLVFHSQARAPYQAISYSREGGEWTLCMKGYSPNLAYTRRGKTYQTVPAGSLLVDTKGRVVSLAMKSKVPADDSWKDSPNSWATISEKQMQQNLKHLEETFAQSLVRVTLQFRSPKKNSPGSDEYHFEYSMGDNTEGAGTERNVPGVVLENGRVLVLASMPPKITARLESIRLNPAKGQPVPATFQATLKDYGAFVATITPPLPPDLKPMSFVNENILAYHFQLLLSAEIQLQGEKMTTYFGHNRILNYNVGWKGRLFPEERNLENAPLFDLQGRLVALPIIRRAKLAVKDRWGEGDEMSLTPSTYLSSVLNTKDFTRVCDLDNVPLSEEEENRLAWFGVELQGLTPQLARMKKISHLTRDGSFGGMVSYVYPGSPAEKAGIQIGDMLIQLHVPDQPKPIEICLEDYSFFGDSTFPWEQLDQVPAEFFDEIPTPWPSVENFLNRTLTDLGFDKPFTVELLRDGKVLQFDSAVKQGPDHYGSAKRYKCEPLKMTVQNLTYEVQRYFRRTPEQEGVIVSKIEPGGPAAVSGIRPYEIVTHVNDQLVNNIRDFQKLVREPGELLMSVKRMNKGRVVKIKNRAPASQPATSAPASMPSPPPVAPPGGHTSS